MTQSSPLASPESWDLVDDGYAELVAPVLAHYARDAITLAAPTRDARVLDVAAGPGTLALIAARQVAHVSALDFSPAMIERLRRDAATLGCANIDAQVGDGQALPYPGTSFDAAFSMFGLIFFPDRGEGLRQLHRVLRPGGRVVIGSWAPFDPDSALVALFAALQVALPALPLRAPELPMGDPSVMRDELSAAGFHDIRVEPATHEFYAADVAQLWASNVRANVFLRLLRRRLAASAWDRASEVAIRELRARFGDGEVRYQQVALLGMGERAARPW